MQHLKYVTFQQPNWLGFRKFLNSASTSTTQYKFRRKSIHSEQPNRIDWVDSLQYTNFPRFDFEYGFAVQFFAAKTKRTKSCHKHCIGIVIDFIEFSPTNYLVRLLNSTSSNSMNICAYRLVSSNMRFFHFIHVYFVADWLLPESSRSERSQFACSSVFWDHSLQFHLFIPLMASSDNNVIWSIDSNMTGGQEKRP